MKLNSTIGLATAALLVAAATPALAEPAGVTVVESQEASIKVGMTSAEVRQILGRPQRINQYRNQPGATYAYVLVGKYDTVFEVDFGSDGKVINTDERIEMRDGNGGSLAG